MFTVLCTPQRLTAVGLMLAIVVSLLLPGRVHAQTGASTQQRATAVRGLLDPGQYHYLGLEPALRDGTVVLTLALEPSNDLDLRGAINFIVLTEDGLRRVLAGADPMDWDIAASAPLQFDPMGNKYQAVFKASGRGEYTVVVFNNGGKFGGYTLTALNGVLLDDAGQTELMVAAPEALTASGTLTETMQAVAGATKASPLTVAATTGTVISAAPSVNAIRISGALDPILSRHFLALKPAERDGLVDLNMVFEPQGRQTEGAVNFWIVTEDGMRRAVYGSRLEDVSLATGMPEPYNPSKNTLVADFKASGSDEYTVVPYSIAPISATYVMKVDGGQLIDRFGQTNESRAALAEYAALATSATAMAASAPAPNSGAGPAAATTTATAAAPSLQLTIPDADGSGATSLTLVARHDRSGHGRRFGGQGPRSDHFCRGRPAAAVLTQLLAREAYYP